MPPAATMGFLSSQARLVIACVVQATRGTPAKRPTEEVRRRNRNKLNMFKSHTVFQKTLETSKNTTVTNIVVVISADKLHLYMTSVGKVT